MKKKTSKLHKILPALSILGILMVALAPLALAQSNFTPPSVLPGSDTDVGGYGDACVGLAGMIRNGTIGLRQIPCFIKYFTQTLIAIAGSLSVIFVMIGGYRYTLGGDEAKDEAKRTITYALIGLAVSLLAWVLVDIVLQLATD